MTDETCPRCSWPMAELPPESRRPGRGGVEYLRCICGSWLARADGVIVGATSSTGLGCHGAGGGQPSEREL